MSWYGSGLRESMTALRTFLLFPFFLLAKNKNKHRIRSDTTLSLLTDLCYDAINLRKAVIPGADHEHITSAKAMKAA
jgi:hypothetical protein